MSGGKPDVSSEKGKSEKVTIDLRNVPPEQLEKIRKKLKEVFAGEEFESLPQHGAGGEVNYHSSHNDDDPDPYI